MRLFRHLWLRWRVFLRGIEFAVAQLFVRPARLVSDLRRLWKIGAAAMLVPSTDDPRIEPDWRGMFFRVTGRAGETQIVQASPGFLFHSRVLYATDSSEVPGTKTVIRGMFVGNRPQMASFQTGILTQMFDREAVGNDLDFDTCDPILSIIFQIQFLVDCTWTAELWGEWRAADDPGA